MEISMWGVYRNCLSFHTKIAIFILYTFCYYYFFTVCFINVYLFSVSIHDTVYALQKGSVHNFLMFYYSFNNNERVKFFRYQDVG